ncbi:MGMT family protein [Candidatus Eisenbacteria bacterium]|uniref:MGMT family protein n=1 Tax=Eiseniibacteriota bacterium TaxID=2212470 RepID=A0ABV6YJJ9_UNCEI
MHPSETSSDGSGLHERIYEIVRQIPEGRVATYGQIARWAGRCTARMAGYAMAAVPFSSDVPWQRVINSKGEVSTRSHGDGHVEQRDLLEAEGVVFNARGRVDLGQYGWSGPGISEQEMNDLLWRG